MRRALALVVVLIGLSACGSDSPAAPSTPFSGNWSGSIFDSLVGSGSVRFTLTQNGANVSGSYGSTYANPAYNGGGSFSGVAAGSALSGTITPSIPTACPYTVNGNLSGSVLSGSYAAFNCTAVDTGTFSVTK